MVRTTRPRRPAGQRQLRVGEELRHALAGILARGEIHDPDVSGTAVTVTEVRVTPNLRQATAFVTPLGGRNAEAVLAGLERCAPWLRGQVTRQVRLKYSPELRFRLDRSFDRASRIDALLRTAGATDENEAGRDGAGEVPGDGS